MGSTPALLRCARPDEAEAITRVTLRAKRHWGYSDDFMAVMTPELTMTAADIERASDRVEVLEADGQLLGFMRLRRRTELAWLEDVFVDPPVMGYGHGRRLFLRAAEVSRGWGYGVMEFLSDPYAEGFYLGLGAKRVGMWPSMLRPGRSIPVMSYALLG